ncbi:hypothetical protein [Streptomyces sp. NPDC057428]|uniref:hypothetical protein n=1 Tax=Streptomyces sp. NPDC057428 TaxID=3346129 RepID=UPI003690F75C
MEDTRVGRHSRERGARVAGGGPDEVSRGGPFLLDGVEDLLGGRSSTTRGALPRGI